MVYAVFALCVVAISHECGGTHDLLEIGPKADVVVTPEG